MRRRDVRPQSAATVENGGASKKFKNNSPPYHVRLIINDPFFETDPAILSILKSPDAHYTHDVILATGLHLADEFGMRSKFFVPRDTYEFENIYHSFAKDCGSLIINPNEPSKMTVKPDVLFMIFNYFDITSPNTMTTTTTIENMGKNYWVILCTIKEKCEDKGSKLTVLYKGPQCEEMPLEIQEILKKSCPFIIPKFISHQNNEGGPVKTEKPQVHLITSNDGPMSLSNIQILMREYKGNDPPKMISYFKTRGNLSTSFDVPDLRQYFYQEIHARFYKLVEQGMEILQMDESRRPEFQKELQNFIDKSLKFRELARGHDFKNYAAILAQEVERDQKNKQEKDGRYQINVDMIEQAHKKFLDNPHLQQRFAEERENLKLNKTQPHNFDHFGPPALENFEWQMKTYTFITRFIAQAHCGTGANDNVAKAIEDFSKIFPGMDVEKVKYLMEVIDPPAPSFDVATEKETAKENFLSPQPQDKGPIDRCQDDDQFVQNLKLVKNCGSSKQPGVKSVEEIIFEFFHNQFESSLHKHFSTKNGQDVKKSAKFYEEFIGKDDDAGLLRNRLRQVEKFRKKFKNFDSNSISEWLHQHDHRQDENFEKNIKLDIDVPEAIAILDRANELTSRGHHQLRDPQILSLILFYDNVIFSGQNHKGKLLQVGTGEGKTTIVAMLAALKILLGEKHVDIITSNSVLAAEAVNEKQGFFRLLNITVDTNNPPKNNHNQNEDAYILGKGLRSCYAAQVVYGSIGQFQFDYLRTTAEGQDTMGQRGHNHPLILDEVDSMLIDNGGHLAKLSVPFPGMDSLRFIYIKIWQSLQQAEAHQVTKMVREIEQNCKEIDETILLAREEIKIQIEESMTPLDLSSIPGHLHDYARSSLGRWIDNAIFAKFCCHHNHHYTLKKIKKNGAHHHHQEEEEELTVIPIDFANTGVTLQNTIWSSGLHQFIQLKHNLQLTNENLTSSMISNYGYINLYGNEKIFGLTGTLGSLPEMDLLSHMYRVSFWKIPRYKNDQFEEIEGMAINDEVWSLFVASDSKKMATQNGRAVLIICKTIADALSIEQSFEDLKDFGGVQNLAAQSDSPIQPNFGGELFELEIKKYLDEDHSSVAKETVCPGQIILATNIAGRGADFCTNKNLEKNGGLHVCLTFYPQNERVKDQAFFRTARQGRKGSAQLVIKKSELSTFSLVESEENYHEIHSKIAAAEKERIHQLKLFKVPQLHFQDKIFAKFSQFSQTHQQAGMDPFVLQDLKEFWAFWLDDLNLASDLQDGLAQATKHMTYQNMAGHVDKIVVDEFYKFCSHPKARQIYEEGRITHNPFYSVQQAEVFLQQNKIELAQKALENALQIIHQNQNGGGQLSSATTPDIYYYAVHVKLFEIAVLKGAVLMNRIKSALTKVLFLDRFVNFTDEEYKVKALGHLQKAQQGLENEIAALNSNVFENPNFHKILIPRQSKSENRATANRSIFPQSQQDENLLYKHLKARATCLKFYLGSITHLIETIEKSGSEGLMVSSRVSNYFQNLDRQNASENLLNQGLTPQAVDDLTFIGMETIYALREVQDAHTSTIRYAQEKIAVGLASMTTGFVFPPSLIVTSQLSSSLISEGILDVVQEVILGQNNDVDGDLKRDKTCMKARLINYAIHLSISGFRFLIHSTGLIQKAIKACNSLIALLRKCPHMQKLCKALAKCLEKLANFLQRQLYLAQETQRLSQLHFGSQTLQTYAENPRLYFEAGKKGLKDVGTSVLRQVTMRLVEDKILCKEDLQNFLHQGLKGIVHFGLIKLTQIDEFRHLILLLDQNGDVNKAADELADKICQLGKDYGPDICSWGAKSLNLDQKVLQNFVQVCTQQLDQLFEQSQQNENEPQAQSNGSGSTEDAEEDEEEERSNEQIACDLFVNKMYQFIVTRVEAKVNDGLERTRNFLENLARLHHKKEEQEETMNGGNLHTNFFNRPLHQLPTFVDCGEIEIENEDKERRLDTELAENLLSGTIDRMAVANLNGGAHYDDGGENGQNLAGQGSQMGGYKISIGFSIKKNTIG